ncbi:MAG: FAD-dependent oxidoreductase, partial [Anaeromusa sp.]|nr:FAD-dependent oxidoreductase [Anaeromusa sp.]
FCIGDAAGLQQEGVLLPMVAPVAVQQARLAVGNILRLLRKEPLQTFSYQDKGAMATVGRHFAVAKIGPLQSKGFLTWVFWLLVHLLRLEGTRNRLAVFFNWGLDYWFATRLVRLIQPHAGTAVRRTAESSSSV